MRVVNINKTISESENSYVLSQKIRSSIVKEYPLTGFNHRS